MQYYITCPHSLCIKLRGTPEVELDIPMISVMAEFIASDIVLYATYQTLLDSVLYLPVRYTTTVKTR